MRDVVTTPEAPRPIGPFSQAIRANGLVFVSGQVAMDPATGQLVPGDVRDQTERVLSSIAKILGAAGSDLSQVVRVGVFLKNMGDFEALNEVYGRHFVSSPPARTTVEVARLPKDALVEIDVVALG